MQREKPLSGQESVWEYPRPPRLEPSSKTVRVVLAGQLIAKSSSAFRVLETSHPPTWYIPSTDVHLDFLTPTRKVSFCEWKGIATYWAVRIGEARVENAAWSYETPNPAFGRIEGYLSFYPSCVDCYVDDEPVASQPGDFYGGWITQDIVGPFKGMPGTRGW